jgi:hypothetical protein
MKNYSSIERIADQALNLFCGIINRRKVFVNHFFEKWWLNFSCQSLKSPEFLGWFFLVLQIAGYSWPRR